MSYCDAFLETIGLSQYGEQFRNEDLNMYILRAMTDDDLKTVGVNTFGHRFKIKEGLKGYTDPIENNTEEEDANLPVDVIENNEEDIDDENTLENVYSNVVFFQKELQSGRITHHISADFFRFDRNTVKKNGRAYFLCSHPVCES